MPYRIPALRALTLTLILTLPAVASRAGGGLTPKGPGCAPGPATLCLDGGRFSVTVDWEDAAMATGQGQVFPFGGSDWGLFYSDDPRYLTHLIHVLNGCGVNGNYWVLATGLSDDEQTLTVTDTVTAEVASYHNPLGSYDLSVNDTGTLPCTVRAGGDDGSRATPDPGTVTAPPTMDLVGHRFQIDVEWRDFTSATGFATPVALTSHSGYFWFFSSSNPEMLVQVFDGSADNGFFHVFAGATTNIETTIRVVDRCTGATKTYLNPLGSSAWPVADVTAFPAAADDCILFEDGFESGDTTAWFPVGGR